jgi:hypothetical protein
MLSLIPQQAVAEQYTNLKSVYMHSLTEAISCSQMDSKND